MHLYHPISDGIPLLLPLTFTFSHEHLWVHAKNKKYIVLSVHKMMIGGSAINTPASFIVNSQSSCVQTHSVMKIVQINRSLTNMGPNIQIKVIRTYINPSQATISSLPYNAPLLQPPGSPVKSHANIEMGPIVFCFKKTHVHKAH